MIDLAEEFRLLAEDESWPWFQAEWIAGLDTKAIHPLRMAQLALMVVEGLARIWFYRKKYGPTPDASFDKWNECIDLAVSGNCINPTDYANVKERVEVAKCG